MADIEHVTKWMEAAAKEVTSLEKNGTLKEVSILEAKTKILPGTWVFRASDPQMEKSPSTKRATVFEATLKKENLKPMPQLLLGFVKDEVSNTVTLTQKGLIQKIIKATGLQDCNPNHTPAMQACLGIDPDGEPMDEFWNYRSIVGMLLYLSTNTRPDITFAVSQVARFNHSPKKSHAMAIKTIVRYLHRTADKGTIVTPLETSLLIVMLMLTLLASMVADPDHSDTSAKSRTGYIITLEVVHSLEVSTANRDLPVYIGI
ncbi:hypothetical protein MHU86_20697 [Fragilaria crotonensis]|nr:hypothetical protein MHU86_20697 [Fragilaria crotonensis]